MPQDSTRREFLAQVGAAAATVAIPQVTAPALAAAPGQGRDPVPRVAIARDDLLLKGRLDEHRDLLRR
ncbi:MAG: hypothetical protein ACYSVY_25730, partial [Planctomycetota bacterium]